MQSTEEEYKTQVLSLYGDIMPSIGSVAAILVDAVERGLHGGLATLLWLSGKYLGEEVASIDQTWKGTDAVFSRLVDTMLAEDHIACAAIKYMKAMVECRESTANPNDDTESTLTA
jgi:hypothetical protein